MNCDFKPGDEIVCVDASAKTFMLSGEAPRLTEGSIYIVSDVFEPLRIRSKTPCGEIGVALLGLEWDVNGVRGAYCPTRFRPVAKRSDTLSIESFLRIKDGFEEPKRVVEPVKKESV